MRDIAFDIGYSMGYFGPLLLIVSVPVVIILLAWRSLKTKYRICGEIVFLSGGISLLFFIFSMYNNIVHPFH